jgi:eukaryotic-like serine/threonine-protein kinase
MAHDVFISYSNKDKNAADATCTIMEKSGIHCWMAPRDITPGAPFAEAIIDGIKGSKIFVLIFSSNSNQSNQVIKEVDRAVHHRLPIITLRLEDAPMSKQLEYYLSDVHWLDALTQPIEDHINKLGRVVQMLLKESETDNEDLIKTLSTKPQKEVTRKTGGSLRNFKLLIPVVFAFLIIATATILVIKRHGKIKWAREVAIPEIERLIEENDVWRNLIEPYKLAVQAEKILGDDEKLTALFSKISLEINVQTDPPGARVFMKEYSKPQQEWIFLGFSPLNKIRVPVGIFRWKLEKEGYETVMAAASTWISGGSAGKPGTVLPNAFIRKMDKVDSIPDKMVRVSATKTPLGDLEDFFIGRYEITNREYKTFIDDGGYKKQEYWKQIIIKNGQQLTLEEAMKEFVDQTGRPGPSTWMGGDYPAGQDYYPVSGVSWYEAAAYAEYKGMKLPTSTHWNVARGGFTPMIQVFQLGGFAVLAPFSNFGGQGPAAVGSLDGVTAYGAYDMAGNVREWCWNETMAGRVIRGGSWEDNTYEFGNQRQAPAMDRSPRNGIRLACYPDPASVPPEVFGSQSIPSLPDISEQKPVSDDIFRIYREQFAYDPMELNAQTEYRERNAGGWIREKVSYDAAYGDERVTAYLFLPENITPPYQTVIYFPGSASTHMTSSDDIESYYEFPMFLSYLVRNGRAVMYPVYKGTFERSDPNLAAIHQGADSYAYSEFLIQMVKDFRRSIDYLETRPDIDNSKLSYYGMSWGGLIGPIITAVEERLKTSIIIAGGLGRRIAYRPEANPVNYITRVRIPTLMLNGMYDVNIDNGIRPMFDLLGTPPEHKRLILYETDHIPPRAEYIKETLAWLDKYLGPVK